MGLARYLGRKALWYLGALIVALLLNFFLPRLIPGNPVDAIVGQLARGGGAGGDQLKAIHEHYMQEFGLNKPAYEQFFIYLGRTVCRRSEQASEYLHMAQNQASTAIHERRRRTGLVIAHVPPWGRSGAHSGLLACSADRGRQCARAGGRFKGCFDTAGATVASCRAHFSASARAGDGQGGRRPALAVRSRIALYPRNR